MSRRNWLDVQSPLFQPIWLRVLIAGFCLIWSLVEFRGGAVFWGFLFGAAGLYLTYQFFVVWNPDGGDEK